MGLRDDGEGQTTGPISSLNEAWFHTLDRCVSDSPLNEIILPLMRNCFFGGAMHAVLLMQKGHGSASFRYCWLFHRRATVVIPKASNARH
jgi:hypothetical protein